MKLLLILLTALMLTACAATPKKTETTDPVMSAEKAIAAGDKLYAQGQTQQALGQYLIALSVQRNDIELLSKVAWLYDGMGDKSAAEKIYRAILEQRPDHVSSIERLGLLLLHRSERGKAGEYLSQALSLGGATWRAYNGLGVLSDLEGSYTEARKYYTDALAKQANEAEVLNNIGFSYYLSGDYDAATTYLWRALERNPEFEPAMSNLGLVYVRSNRLQDAEQVFKKIMDPHIAYNNIGYLSLLTNDNETARRYFLRAIKASPIYYKEAHENLRRVSSAERS